MKSMMGAGLLVVCLASGCGSTDRGSAACKDPNPQVSVGACTALLRSTALADSARAGALLSRGVGYRAMGDYDRAIADYDQAIQLSPGIAAGYNNRGFAYQLKGDFERAVADYNEAIRLNPDLGTAVKNRGRAQFYLGHFPEAAADLRSGIQLDSTNAYVAIWLHLVAMRLGKDDAAEFAAQLARTDSLRWPAPIARFYLGRLTADQLMAAAATDTTRQGDQRCAADFYIGESELWKRRIPEATRRFQDAAAACPKDWSEYQGAVAELDRLTPPR